MKQISRLIIINPRAALIIESRHGDHPPLRGLGYPSRRSAAHEILLTGPEHEHARVFCAIRGPACAIMRGGTRRYRKLSSQLRSRVMNAPFHPLFDLLCIHPTDRVGYRRHGVGGNGSAGTAPGQARIASSLAAINCQNVPHNSARAKRPVRCPA